MGTRLRSVLPDDPKSLAEIGDRAFLDILLDIIFDQGFERVILAVGHLKEKIIDKYAEDPRVKFSIEDSPLGTGGAAMNALELAETEHIIVMNGDCFCEVDLKEMYEEHKKHKSLITLVLSKSDDISDFGSVLIDENSRILSFREKVSEKSGGLISAGIYVFNKEIKNHKPEKNSFSLEHDLFPLLVGEHFCYGHVIPGGFLDIGTPERYALAKRKFGKKNSK